MVIQYLESNCLEAMKKASCSVVRVNGIEWDVSLVRFTKLAFILVEVLKVMCGEKVCICSLIVLRLLSAIVEVHLSGLCAGW